VRKDRNTSGNAALFSLGCDCGWVCRSPLDRTPGAFRRNATRGDETAAVTTRTMREHGFASLQTGQTRATAVFSEKRTSHAPQGAAARVRSLMALGRAWSERLCVRRSAFPARPMSSSTVECRECGEITPSWEFRCRACNSPLTGHPCYHCGYLKPDHLSRNDRCPRCKKRSSGVPCDHCGELMGDQLTSEGCLSDYCTECGKRQLPRVRCPYCGGIYKTTSAELICPECGRQDTGEVIGFNCVCCLIRVRAPSERAGKKGRCPRCCELNVIPHMSNGRPFGPAAEVARCPSCTQPNARQRLSPRAGHECYRCLFCGHEWLGSDWPDLPRSS
jgi:hypothetical protein